MSDGSKSEPELSAGGSDAESDTGTSARPLQSNVKLAANDHSGVFRAINSILTSKRPSEHVNPILSKRRKLAQKEAAENEICEAKARIAANNKVLERRKMQDKDVTKPDVSTAAHEHVLRKIATRGVLRLFNAIAQHQRQCRDDVDENLPHKAQKEKAQKKKAKSRDLFLKLLRGQEIDLSHAITGAAAASKDEAEGAAEGGGSSDDAKDSSDEDEKSSAPAPAPTQPKWRVLQDDLLLGPSKLKDWDAASESSEDDEKTQRLNRKFASRTTVVPEGGGGIWDGLSDSDEEQLD